MQMMTNTCSQTNRGSAPIIASRPEIVFSRTAGGDPAAFGAADWLCLAAAPTFAMMALLTGVLGGGAPDLLCSVTKQAFPLNGMVLMYVLMSAFHLAPWLRLISGRSRGPVAIRG
jgi:hypothetical protein